MPPVRSAQSDHRLFAMLLASLLVLTSGWVVTTAGPAQGVTAGTSFTIAVVPDTQNEVIGSNRLLSDRYQWLANNRAALNLQLVTHVGDIVNWGVADPTQFTLADSSTQILDAAKIPYSYAIGNHDTAAVTTGGSAAPGSARTNLRNTTAYNTTFPVSRFVNVGGVFETGKVDNMFQTFTAGGRSWLVLTLEMWPRQSALDWAKKVLTDHPGHDAIIVSHALVDGYGAYRTAGNYGNIDAQGVWDQLISQYANVRIVLSGHYAPADGGYGAWYAQRTGAKGNKIAEIMTAYQSSTQNHVRLLTVDMAGDTLSSRVYVNKSFNGAPVGWIKDGSSDFVAANMNWAGNSVPPTQLLPDPGFETGAGGWRPFVASTMSLVASPVRGGAAAMNVAVDPTSSSTLVGMTQNTAMSNSVTGTSYTFGCYVRPSISGRSVIARLRQYTSTYSSNVQLASTSVSNLAVGEWTYVSVSGVATASGQRVIPQIYSTNLTGSGGTIAFDDCSFTTS